MPGASSKRWHRALSWCNLRPMRPLFVFALALLSLTACHASQEAAPPAPTASAEPPRAAPAPLAQTKFGHPITETKVTPLTQLVGDPGRFADQTVRTEGLVTGVCQAKGCWMQLSDESGAAHVKFAGYAFFVPKNAGGHRAIVQGKVVSKDNSCNGKDGCREAGEKASGRVAKIDFEATGVELLN